MRVHLRFVAVLAVALTAYVVLLHAFHLMNQPSDQGWYGGLAMIFGLVVLAPILIRAIWRVL